MKRRNKKPILFCPRLTDRARQLINGVTKCQRDVHIASLALGLEDTLVVLPNLGQLLAVLNTRVSEERAQAREDFASRVPE